MDRPRVVLGFVGTTLDAGLSETRWERWRPSVAICAHAHFPIRRLELLHDMHATGLGTCLTGDIAQVSPGTAVSLHLLNVRNPWDFEEVYGALHDFARAYPFDPEAEDYFVSITTGTHVMQICWFLLIESRHIPAKLLQAVPPRRWGTQDPGRIDVIDIDLSRYDRIAQRFREESLEATSFLKSGIPTRSASFNATIERIERVAIRSKAPLLLTGPTGAGKSQLARRIYELKRRERQISGSFVAVNCATLRGDGAMSALFGHRRGAFTGAAADRAGLLREADRGILFLDEIGELGADEQAMVLRAVEDKRFLPVGADREVGSDFQLVAGTNLDLGEAVERGGFREDLLARLNLWTFALPGLAERREDIEPNLDFELRRFARDEGEAVSFNREARARFLAFAVSPEAEWRASFRDLGASVTRMATLAPSGRIDVATVQEEIGRLRRLWARGGPGDGLAALLGGRLAEVDPFDRPQLAAVVAACRAHPTLSAAGRALFSVSRARKTSVNDADRLRKYLARFDLDWDAVRGGAGP